MSIRQTADPVPLRQAIAEWLDAMADPLAEINYRRTLCREAYWRGYEDGYRDGQNAPAEALDVDDPAPWPTSIDPALDRLRYPPDGRLSWLLPGQGGAA